MQPITLLLTDEAADALAEKVLGRLHAIEDQPNGYWSAAQICRLLNITPAVMYYAEKTDPTFPQSALTVGRSRLWHRADVEAWIKQRQAIHDSEKRTS